MGGRRAPVYFGRPGLCFPGSSQHPMKALSALTGVQGLPPFNFDGCCHPQGAVALVLPFDAAAAPTCPPHAQDTPTPKGEGGSLPSPHNCSAIPSRSTAFPSCARGLPDPLLARSANEKPRAAWRPAGRDEDPVGSTRFDVCDATTIPDRHQRRGGGREGRSPSRCCSVAHLLRPD